MKFFTCLVLMFCSIFVLNSFIVEKETKATETTIEAKQNETEEYSANFVNNQVIVILDEKNSKLIKIPDFSFFKGLEIDKIVNLTPRKKIGDHEKHYRISPRNRKAGQEGAELVLPHRAPDLSQVIKI